jgi:uncharacterized protein YjbI with pentapeptide repeats
LLIGAVLGQTFAWMIAGDASWWNPWTQLTSSQMYDVVRSDVAAVAIVGAGGAALIGYRRQRTTEDQQKTAAAQQRTAESQHGLERERHALAESTDLRGRYGSAAEQLGHERAAVRLAGAYAMAELADEWSRRGNTLQQQVCIDVLCAYLRMPSGQESAEQEPEVRATIARILESHLRDPDSEASWCEADINLSGAHLHNIDFAGVQLLGKHVSFSGAYFEGSFASFREATFSDDTSFAGAIFSTRVTNFMGVEFAGRCMFVGTQFNGLTEFSDANFYKASHFMDATFSGQLTTFTQATFRESVNFFDATFAGHEVDFTETTFPAEWVNFMGEMSPGANFGGAVFAGRYIALTGARSADGSTVDLSTAGRWTPEVRGEIPVGVRLPGGVINVPRTTCDETGNAHPDATS